MTTRSSVVAGSFYPGDNSTLQKMLSLFIKKDTKKIDNALAVVAPHAGYVYSGKTAGAVYSSINIPNTVIILSPNHTGLGYPISIDPSDKWETPLGLIDLDTSFVNRIKQEFKEAKLDTSAQTREHALEVQLPFIQYLNLKAKIVPITLAGLDLSTMQKLGQALAKIILEVEKETGSRPLIVASSDMTHFESAEAARKKDMMAIDKIKDLDTKGFICLVEKEDISLCGLYTVPVAMEAALQYTKQKSLKPKVDLIDYTNSGEVTGDSSEVVAYAGMVISF
jgi:MEMO1 family protein